MNLLVTKTDFCLPNLVRELDILGVGYQADYIEDYPELESLYQIRHSPNIFIDGEPAFRRQP